ncbi:glycosyltransferase [Glutamicibacter protophormiae]|uniref:D-inositol 3-phosphate glycosyltransferase n=1 Tax=Glutamicibacter protophormiae TaxID=37930 RepID=A0ABS4XTB2_GLUPR|nr:glycosyltransferase [Glutamicibacter protophormiae]MBP2399590.1 D-inositol-3-phosphate glycosyltransferase [Glutamicibacter protophormiae]GGL87599.1 D-inositol 3-phosphate glycosyltransferase [Glutamicibacter protophormiae]
MRIAMLSLHTSPMQQPGSGDAGGMNVYIQNLSFALGALGHEVHMVTRTAADSESQQVAEGVWMHQVQIAAHQQMGKEELPQIIDPAAAAISEHLHGLDIDIIHAHYWLSGMVGLQLAREFRAPLILSMHTSAAAKEFESGIPEPGPRKQAEKQLLAEASRIIANTPVEARQLARFYEVDRQKLDVVLPGVNHRIFHPEQDKLCRPLGPDDLHLVYAGRLQPLKGAHVMLEAMGLARRSHPQLRITASLFGARSGSADYDLQALVEREDLADLVRFFDPLKPAQLAAVFANADVVAVPSLSETFGLVAAEAQACGTPVLANAVGGLGYAVRDGRSGWLMPEPDPQLWAQKLVELAENPKLVTQAGHDALEHSGEFTWERAAVASLASYRMAQSALIG